MLAEAQAENQIAPRLVEVLPGGQLVAERIRVLRPAEQVRLVSGVCRRKRAIRPGETPLRRLVVRPLATRAARQDTALALDEHITNVRRRTTDQCDTGAG